MITQKYNHILSTAVFVIIAAGMILIVLTLSMSASAPDISLKTLDGKTVSLKSLQGKPTLVTFWATDCPGCLKEMPHLIALHNDYAKKGVTIIGIAMHYDKPEHVRAMVADRKLPYSIVLDTSAEASKAFGNVRLTPTNFLIAPDGTIALQKIGEFDDANMRLKIEELLGNS